MFNDAFNADGINDLYERLDFPDVTSVTKVMFNDLIVECNDIHNATGSTNMLKEINVSEKLAGKNSLKQMVKKRINIRKPIVTMGLSKLSIVLIILSRNYEILIGMIQSLPCRC